MSRILAYAAGLAAAAILGAAAQANTLRYSFDTSADFNYTAGWGNLALEQSNRGYDPSTGDPHTRINGYFDLEFNGTQFLSIVDYNFQTTVPHGIPDGFFTGASTPDIEMDIQIQPGTGTRADLFANGVINLWQPFTFVTPYGPIGGANNPNYDPNDTTAYTFEAQLQFQIGGTRADGLPNWQVDDLRVRCAFAVIGQPHGSGCNYFGFSQNRGEWNSTSGFAQSATVLEPPAAVPLPAGVALLLSGLAGFAAIGRRQRKNP